MIDAGGQFPQYRQLGGLDQFITRLAQLAFGAGALLDFGTQARVAGGEVAGALDHPLLEGIACLGELFGLGTAFADIEDRDQPARTIGAGQWRAGKLQWHRDTLAQAMHFQRPDGAGLGQAVQQVALGWQEKLAQITPFTGAGLAG